jgi:hypothetical protein
MGGQQSTIHKGSSTNKDGSPCHPCFAFQAPFQQHASDPLGSPLPDTPLTKRKQQRGMYDQGGGTTKNGQPSNGQSTPIYSSRYGGLEKEPDSRSSIKTDSSLSNEEYQAKIYEGPVSASLCYVYLCVLHILSIIHELGGGN